MEPTYPLFPIFSLISAALLLLILINNAIRRSFNFGLFMICLGLFCLNFTYGVGSIAWADNVDVKVPVWCDIASHLQLFGVIIVPAGSLVVTRRLYLIASRRPISSLEPRQQRTELIIECLLLLLLPALYISIFYYTSQVSRFQIFEGYGCTNAIWGSGMSIILLDLPALIPPAISTLFYCPRILWVFYTQRKVFKQYLSDSSSASSEPRTNYMRLLAIGCLDIVLTLPVQAIGVFLDSKSSDPFIFYPGWSVVHADWTPLVITREEWRASGWGTFTLYFTLWANVVLAYAIIGLFAFTPEALDVYKRGLSSVSKRFAGARTQDTNLNPATSALVFRSGRTETETYSADGVAEVDMKAYRQSEAGEYQKQPS
ncbi:unnamed protein product [Peniophora sp. CBMAI 1063]|nr:unnamed protein product [Peniophora sp. CBMAI 1063]